MSQYTHIVVTVDFSESTDKVIKKAIEIARLNKAKLSLLHVVEYLPPIDSAYEPIFASSWAIDENQLIAAAENSLQKLSDKYKLKEACLKVALGTPKFEITQFVTDQQCDLIVIGSHGRHGISLLLGSTANAILHAMPCDILAIKVKE